MLRKIKNNILNYLFKQFELKQRQIEKNDYNDIISQLKKEGNEFVIGKDFTIFNPQFMQIGNSFSAGDRFRIEAWDKYHEQIFFPKIVIGNNVTFNSDIHIGCVNYIEIGDNCLFASRIYITDHHHGEPTSQMLKLAPNDRPLVSKGPVIIEKNVWIGEGVAIMPNVTIGENSIIGSNAVVTKNIPANCVAAGVPAKIIKIIN